MARNRRWALGIVLLLVIAAGISLVLASARWQVAKYRAQLRAHGVKLTVSDLVPPWPAPEENVGQQLAILSENLSAGSALPEEYVSAMHLVGPGRARVAWQQATPMDLPLKDPSYANWTWGAIGDILDADLDLLAKTREVLARPHMDLKFDYLQGFSMELPHLSLHKALARQLARTVVFQLHAGELAAVADNLHALLTLAARQSEEPIMISQWVQMAITEIGLAVTWEALQAPGWQEPQLARLQRDWESLSFVPPLKQAVGLERASVIMEFERARKSLAALDRVLSVDAQSGREGLTRRALWQCYWSYPDELHYLKFLDELAEDLQELGEGKPWAPILARLKTYLAGLKGDASDREGGSAQGFVLTLRAVSWWEKIVTRIGYAETTRRLATTALACERYRLVHGQTAPNLAALVPAFLPAVPLDPMDGQPLRYRSGPAGIYLLYGVGEDGRDDGGDGHPSAPSSKELTLIAGKDWVWPAVATLEDIAGAAQNER